MDAPNVWVILISVPLGSLKGSLLFVGSEWWLDRRAQRQWGRGEAERQRRWAEEDRRQVLRQQLREMEAAVRERQWSDEEQAWWRQRQEREAAITREARQRLGMPEEDDPT